MSGDGSVLRGLEGLRTGDDADIGRLWDHDFHRLLALAGSRFPGHDRRDRDEEDVALSAFRSFFAELVATVEVLCVFEDGDRDDSYTLAHTLTWFVPFFEDGWLTGLPEPQRSKLRRRCTDRAAAVPGRACDCGFPDVFQQDVQIELDPIRRAPGYRALVERLKNRQVPENRCSAAH